MSFFLATHTFQTSNIFQPKFQFWHFQFILNSTSGIFITQSMRFGQDTLFFFRKGLSWIHIRITATKVWQPRPVLNHHSWSSESQMTDASSVSPVLHQGICFPHFRSIENYIYHCYKFSIFHVLYETESGLSLHCGSWRKCIFHCSLLNPRL